MERLTDDRFLKNGFYQPKNKDEEKEIRSMGKDLTFEKLYRHCAELEKKNAELQKKVDELKNYAERLFEENQDHYDKLQNANLYIEKHEPIWKRNTEQAVKDTAKEICMTAIQLSDMCESFYEFQNRLIDLIEANYGVEIVHETIIPAKGTEVE